MSPDIFTSPQTQEIISFVRQEYGDELEFLWPKTPKNAIWRNPQSRKWYAALLTISLDKLPGQTAKDEVEILDLRFPKGEALDFATTNPHIFPGYHMSKQSWITIVLDGRLATARILPLLDQSYTLSMHK